MAIDAGEAFASSFKFGTHELQGTASFEFAAPLQHGAFSGVAHGDVNLAFCHGESWNYNWRPPNTGVVPLGWRLMGIDGVGWAVSAAVVAAVAAVEEGRCPPWCFAGQAKAAMRASQVNRFML